MAYINSGMAFGQFGNAVVLGEYTQSNLCEKPPPYKDLPLYKNRFSILTIAFPL